MKRIEVASVVSDSDANRVFVQLLEVKTEKRTLTARLAVHKLHEERRGQEKPR